jgi:arylsulfatase A-like enzyme
MTSLLRRAARSAALAAVLLAPLLAGGCGDDGGSGGAATRGAGQGAGAAKEGPVLPPGSRPNVLVLTIDTVRADHLGCYGYARNTTRRLDALARESVVFDHAFANSSFTPPAHASILTSLYPGEHGLVHWSRHLADVPTAAELFKAAGYRTAAFTPIPTLLKLGLDRGFSLATGPEVQVLDGGQRIVVGSADEIMEQALPFLTARADRPFFAWLHFYDAHRPYARQGHEWSELFSNPDDPDVGSTEGWYQLTPEARKKMYLTDAQVQLIKNHYDGGLAFLDNRIGRLVDALSSAGVLEDTVIVVVADHGEVLDEHEQEYFSHDPYLTEENIHIPLLLRLPGRLHPGLRVPDLVEQVDVLPTLLELAGVAPPDYMSGLSLVPTLQGRRLPRSFVAAETQREDPSHRPPPPPGKPPLPVLTEDEIRAARDRQLMVRTESRKFLLREDRRQMSLHAVDGSAPESKDLLAVEKATAASASAALRQWRDSRHAPSSAEEQPALDDDTRAMLQGLGYLGGGSAGSSKDGGSNATDKKADG